MSAEIRQVALDHAARGWSVIPMQPRGKRPLVAWRGFQQHRASVEQIQRWFAREPEANLGIVTGRVSDLVVVDIDLRHGGPDSVAALEALHGPLPPTVEAITGGGGRHLYYRHPGGSVPSRVAIQPGIDIRGDGGCVVAPPSVHPSGRRYEWRRGRAPGEQALAAAPIHFFGASATQRPAGRSPTRSRRPMRDSVGKS